MPVAQPRTISVHQCTIHYLNLKKQPKFVQRLRSLTKTVWKDHHKHHGLGVDFQCFQKTDLIKDLLKAKSRYYVKILYVIGIQNKGEYFLRVSWKQPQESNFAVIESDSLFLFTNDSEAGKHKMYDDELPKKKSCFKEGANQRYKNKHESSHENTFLRAHRGEQSAFFMWILTRLFTRCCNFKKL